MCGGKVGVDTIRITELAAFNVDESLFILYSLISID
jgi:hypothetical protein